MNWMRCNLRSRLPARPGRQRGWLTLEMSFAIVVAAVASFIAFQSKLQANDADLAVVQADAILAMRTAAHKLVIGHYADYQKGLPIAHIRASGGVVNLAAGTSVGQAQHPTVAQMRSMDLGVNDFQDGGIYKALTNAGYDIFITRTSQCSTNPDDSLCRVTGLVCLNQPVSRYSASGTEHDSTALGVMLNRIGPYGYGSFMGTGGAQLLSSTGQTSEPNPYGNVEGTVCAKFGWAAEFDDYVRRFDSRDPSFRGDVSLAGSLGVGEVVDGSGNKLCSLGSILSSGQILSRSTSCIRRAWMDGSTGQMGVADASGATRALLDGASGNITSLDAAGNAKAGIRYNASAQSEVYADNLLNNAGNAGIKSDGTLFGTAVNANSFNGMTVIGNQGQFDKLTLNATANLGAACSPDGAMSWAPQGGRWIIARCTGGVWTSATGVNSGVVGAACGAIDGVPAIAPNGAQLVCQGGQWVYLMERMGKTVLMASYLTSDGASVPKPTCLSGSTGTAAYMALGSEQQGVQYSNRYLTDNGSSWTVQIKNGLGNTILGDVVVLTYCIY